MRSTWVMIMRRQQYRFRPSSSIASLSNHQSNAPPPPKENCLPIGLSRVCDELKIPFPEVAGDLVSLVNTPSVKRS